MLWPPQGSVCASAASPITTTPDIHAATNSPDILRCILLSYHVSAKEKASVQSQKSDHALILVTTLVTLIP